MKKSLPAFLFLSVLSGSPVCVTGQAVAGAVSYVQAAPRSGTPAPETRKLKEVLQEFKNHYQVDIIFFNSTVADFAVPAKDIRLEADFEKSLKNLLRPSGLSFKKGRNGGYIVTGKRKSRAAEPAQTPEKAAPQPQSELPEARLTAEQTVDKTTVAKAAIVEKAVHGNVVDEKGEALPGVSVLVKGTQVGTVTDAAGTFAVNVPDENALLVFSFIGFKPQEVMIGNRTTVEIRMAVDNKELDELVVVGYGTQKKGNITGAVSTVKIDDNLTGRSLPNASSMMQGLIPGLAVNQNSGMAGNNSAQLIIRGLGTVNNASPLVVVDGMPDVDINRVNPNDIESISVLKDAASSSVYGSRAANGVILITTKSGKGSKDTKISASVSYAMEKPTRSFEFMADYPRALTVHQRAAAVNTLPSNFLFRNGTIDQWMALGMIDPVKYPNTDWWDVILRTGQQKNYNVSASGGTDKTNFFISVGAMDEKGIQIENDFKRYNARINYDAKIRSKMNVGVRFAGNWSKFKYNYTEGFTANSANGLDLFTAPAGILPFDPTTGYFGGVMAYNENSQSTNPYVDYMNRNKNNQNRQEFNGSAYWDWSPIAGLTGRVEYALNYYNQFTWRSDIPTRAFNFQTNAFGPRIYVGEDERIYNYSNTGYKTQLSGRLNYDKVIAKNHEVGVMAAYSEEFWYNRSLTASRQDRLHPSLHEIDAALNDIQSTSGTSNREGLRSYIGRLNYTAFGRYLLEANFRYDGSSKFLPGNRFGFFPSVALGWRFTDERFINRLTDKIGLSNGKLRVSYGSLGNNSGVGYYEQQETLGTSSYFIDGKIVKGFVNQKFINQNLTWEKTTVLNAGLDLGFLKNRLFVELDYYNRLTTGMNRPSDLSIMLTGAYNPPRTNIGDMRNQGVEANLTWREQRGEFRYQVNLNASYNQTRLEKWNELLLKGYVFLDMPYHFLYTYEDTGIAQTWADVYAATPQGAAPGDLLLKDLNGDGRIDANDMKAYPKTQRDRPTTNFALNSSVGWRQFDLAFMFQGSAGRKDFWLNSANNTRIPTANFAATWDHWNNVWSLDNRNAGLPRLMGNLLTSNNQAQTSYWVDDMSYVRLKNLQIGYSVPKAILKKVRVNRLRIYVSADNLLTFTRYRGLDPEKSSYASEAYPIVKTFVGGLNLEF